MDLDVSKIVVSLNKIVEAITGMAAYSVFAENETPAGAINGANAVFTLAHVPAAGSLQLFLNGMYQTPAGEDYTLVSATITFVSAPLTGSIMRVFYKY